MSAFEGDGDGDGDREEFLLSVPLDERHRVEEGNVTRWWFDMATLLDAPGFQATLPNFQDESKGVAARGVVLLDDVRVGLEPFKPKLLSEADAQAETLAAHLMPKQPDPDFLTKYPTPGLLELHRSAQLLVSGNTTMGILLSGIVRLGYFVNHRDIVHHSRPDPAEVKDPSYPYALNIRWTPREPVLLDEAPQPGGLASWPEIARQANQRARELRRPEHACLLFKLIRAG